MRPQINLYQPIFSDERKAFSAGSAGVCLVLLLCGLAAMSFSAYLRVKEAASELEVLRAQQREQEEALVASGDYESAATIEARVARLDRRVQERARALEILSSGAAGTTVGFAPRLEALARRHVEGLWIDAMQLSGTNGAMMLAGSTTDPDIVPTYLRSLAADDVLAGTRFDDFVISRTDDREQDDVKKDKTLESYGSKPVRFRAGSTALTPRASEEASS